MTSPRFANALPPNLKARRPTWGQTITAAILSGMRCIRLWGAGIRFREVSRRLGVRAYSLSKWLKLFGGASPKPDVDREAENRRLKRERARVTEERDILKRATAYFA